MATTPFKRIHNLAMAGAVFAFANVLTLESIVWLPQITREVGESGRMTQMLPVFEGLAKGQLAVFSAVAFGIAVTIATYARYLPMTPEETQVIWSALATSAIPLALALIAYFLPEDTKFAEDTRYALLVVGLCATISAGGLMATLASRTSQCANRPQIAIPPVL